MVKETYKLKNFIRGGTHEIGDVLIFIANELSEMNRLKRKELRKSGDKRK